MALNMFKKIVLYSSLALSALAFSPKVSAQNNAGVSDVHPRTFQEEQRRKEAMEAYTTLRFNIADSAGIQTQISTGREVQEAKRDLEAYLGEELYHKTSAGIQTYPSSGAGSISFEDGEYWVNTTQVGIGKFKGENYSYAKFKAEAPRDFSYTYSIFFNAAGYNGEVPANTDERAREIVSKNSGVPFVAIEVKRSYNDLKIDDIVSIEKENSLGVLNEHPMVIGYSEKKHILFVPGQKAKFPLDNIAYIVDLIEMVPVVQTTTMPGEEISRPEPDTVFVQIPAPMQSIDSALQEPKTYRFILSLSMTNKQVPGVKAAFQVADKWDLEVGYEFLKVKDYSFSNFTMEELDNPNILNRDGTPKYMGHSELTERGLENISLNAFSLNAVRRFGNEDQFGLAVGAVLSLLNENYKDGQEDRKTWIVEKETGEKIAQDRIVTEGIFYNNKSLTLNPQFGLRGYFGRFAVGLDYILNLNKESVKYYPDYDGLGNFRFSIGFNLGVTKADNQSSTSGQKIVYDYKENE